MNSIDVAVQSYLVSMRTQGATEFMYFLTTVFDLSVRFILLALCVSVLIYLIRGKRYAVLFLSALTVGGVIVYFMKSFFNVDRPADQVIGAFGQSFPSYHATIVTIFFGMMMYIFHDKLKVYSRIIFNSLSIIIIAFVSLSRLYLGVHWLSDVTTGILMGFLICFVFIKIYDKSLR